MHPELQSLIELQMLDSKILTLQEMIDNIPSKVKTVEQPFIDARSKYERQKKHHEECIKKKKDKEFQLDEINDKVNKQKDKSSDIKTNKEYQAHLKSIETLDNERLKVEDELLVLMEQSDDMTKELKQVEDLVNSEEKKIEQFKKSLKAEVHEAEKDLASLRSQRAEISGKTSMEVYDSYMKQLEYGQGLAVVEVREEICHGCNMNIPPQLFVEVRKGDELYNCPQCRRFLYFQQPQNES
ncbi:MAG: C4-type zinc ribbon domain-containing protein [Thermodesulfovibrionales bacterium]